LNAELPSTDAERPAPAPDKGFPLKQFLLSVGGAILLAVGVFAGLLYYATRPQKTAMTVVSVQWQRSIQVEERDPKAPPGDASAWIATRIAEASDNTPTPKWPDVPNTDTTRAGKRTEKYLVRLRSSRSPRIYEQEVRLEDFPKFAPGALCDVIIQEGVVRDVSPPTTASEPQ
jgi:hypothetical protein